jgi:hypothetical protein
MVCVAFCHVLLVPNGAPVFGLGANCGESLDEISIRMRWPSLNRLLVGQTWIL